MSKIRKFVNSKIVAYFSIIVLLDLIYIHFINGHSETMQGAFWAIVVSYFTYLIAKYNDLLTRRYNTMIKLQHELSRGLNDLSNDLFLINDALNDPNIKIFIPVEITLNEDYIKDLARIEVRDDICILFLGIKQFNHGLQSSVEYLKNNVTAFRNTPYEPPAHAATILKVFQDAYKSKLTEINEFGQKIESEMKDCLVKLRFFSLIDRPLFAHNIFLAYYSKTDYQKWLKEDRKKLENDIIEKRK